MRKQLDLKQLLAKKKAKNMDKSDAVPSYSETINSYKSSRLYKQDAERAAEVLAKLVPKHG